MKKTILAFLASGVWISLSEFVRNELLFKSYWLEKYAGLGLPFPSAPINNALWGLWSFLLAGVIVYLSAKVSFVGTIVVSWIAAFLMMWVVIGNLNVLPIKLLVFAVPLSVIEVMVAAVICRKIFGNPHR